MGTQLFYVSMFTIVVLDTIMDDHIVRQIYVGPNHYMLLVIYHQNPNDHFYNPSTHQHQNVHRTNHEGKKLNTVELQTNTFYFLARFLRMIQKIRLARIRTPYPKSRRFT